MKARDLFERLAAPAPVEAPPKPGVRPDAPPRPADPGKHPNPFRRRQRPGYDPGPLPKPKACIETKAKELFSEGYKHPSREKAIKDGWASPLDAKWPPVETPAMRDDKRFKETHRTEIEKRAKGAKQLIRKP